MQRAVKPVSVIVPCYNHERYVERCLRSINEQTIGPIEIIVIDDGSTDSSWQKIRSFSFRPEHEVTVLRSPNRGAHAALNEGLSRARGEWLAICNSDDFFANERLEHMVARATAVGSAFAFSKIWCVDADGRNVSEDTEYSRNLLARQNEISSFPSVGWSLMPTNVAISTGNFVFRRELVKTVGFFRPYKLVHDWDYALRALLVAEPVYIPEALYAYRLHGTNSFKALNEEVAARECPELMRRYWKAAHRSRPANPQAPSPFHWPVFNEVFLAELHYQPYLSAWEGIDEPYYAPPVDGQVRER